MEDYPTNDISLKQAIFRELDQLKADIDRRFAAQEVAVSTAFEASKEAITKSEVGTEKRADAVYVTIAKLTDSLVSVMPRAEAEQRFRAIAEKVEILKTGSDTTSGRASGFDKSWGYLLGLLGAVTAVIATVIAIVMR